MLDFGLCLIPGSCLYQCSTLCWVCFLARASTNARLPVRLLGLKKSSKKSVLAENRLPVRVFEGKKSSIESSIVTRLQENVFRARKNSPPSKSNFKSNISGQKTWTKCWNSAKIQLRVQHFGAEKLDNELNIKWEPTFLMTCSKIGDVFLRQRLFCVENVDKYTWQC